MSTGIPRLQPQPSPTTFTSPSTTSFSQRGVSIPPWDTLQDLASPSEASSGDELDELDTVGVEDRIRPFPRPPRPTSSTPSQPRTKTLSHLHRLGFPVMPPTTSNDATSKNGSKPSSLGVTRAPPAQTNSLFLPSDSPPVAAIAPRTTAQKIVDVPTPTAKKVQATTATPDLRRVRLQPFRPLKRKGDSRTETNANSSPAGVGNVANKRARYEGSVGWTGFSRDRVQASDNRPGSAGSSKNPSSSTTSSATRSVSSPSRSAPGAGPGTSSGSTSNSSSFSPFLKPQTPKPSSSSSTPDTSAVKPRTSLDSTSSSRPLAITSKALSPSRPSTSSATAPRSMGPPKAIPPGSKLFPSRTIPSIGDQSRPKPKLRALKRIATAPHEVIELFDSDSDTDKPNKSVQPKPRKPSPKQSYKIIQEEDCIVITDESDDEAEVSAKGKGKEKEQTNDEAKAKEISMNNAEESGVEAPSTPRTPSASPANTHWPTSRIAGTLAKHTLNFSPLQSANPLVSSTAPSTSKAKDVVMASSSSPPLRRPEDNGQPDLLPAAPIVGSSSKARTPVPSTSSASEMDVDPQPKAIPPTPSPRREFLRKPRDDEMDVDDSGDDLPVLSPPKPHTPAATVKPRPLPSKHTPPSTSKTQLHPSPRPSLTPVKKPALLRPQPTPPSSDAEDSEADRLNAVLKERPTPVKAPVRKGLKHRHSKSLSISAFFGGDDDASTSTTNAKEASASTAPPSARVTPPNKRDMSRTARKTMINPKSHSRNSSANQQPTSAAVADAIAHQGRPDSKLAVRTAGSTSKAGRPSTSTTPAVTFIDLTLDDSDEERSNAKTTTPQVVSPPRKPPSAMKPRPGPLPVGTTLGSLGNHVLSQPAAFITTSPVNTPGTPPPLSSAVPSGTASPERPESNEVRRRSAPPLPPPPPAPGAAASPPKASDVASPPAFQALLRGLSVHGTVSAPVSPGGFSSALGSRRSPAEVEETDAAVETDGGKPSGGSDVDVPHHDLDDDAPPSGEEQEVQAFLEVDSEVPPTDSEVDLDHPPPISAKEKGKGRAMDVSLPEPRSSSPDSAAVEDRPTRRVTRSQAFSHDRPSISTSTTVVDPSHLFDHDDEVQDAATLPSEPAKPLSDATNSRRTVIPPKTYGGYPALTWTSFRSDLRNFQRVVKWSKDIDRDLHDAINAYTPYARGHPQIRNVFEGMMLFNTSFDEPEAPPIKIINDIDAEPNPPWEFYYTNEMYLAPDVPPPDLENLVGCDCVGGCDPKVNKNCACVQKNHDAFSTENLDFLYDKNGKLKMPGFPIYECNDLCSCGDECRNRVVQHGRKVPVSIKKTQNKGWGIFAGSKKIPKGTFIGIYSGELITEEAADERGVNYDRFGKTYLFDLDFHHLRTGESNWKSKLTVDAYHVGNFTRFLNHSCDPNCRLYPCYVNEANKDKPMLTIFAIRDIEPEEEICFNYQGKYPGDEDGEEDTQGDEDKNERDKSAEKVHEPCRCEAPNCTGIMFGR